MGDHGTTRQLYSGLGQNGQGRKTPIEKTGTDNVWIGIQTNQNVIPKTSAIDSEYRANGKSVLYAKHFVMKERIIPTGDMNDKGRDFANAMHLVSYEEMEHRSIFFFRKGEDGTGGTRRPGSKAEAESRKIIPMKTRAKLQKRVTFIPSGSQIPLPEKNHPTRASCEI